MKAKLLINSAVGNESFEYDLNKPEIKIGRSPQSNDIVLIDVQISREHAIVRTQGDEVTLVDLQSANGSFINGNRISGESRITEEDSLQIGKYIIKLKLEQEITLPPNMPMGKPGGTIVMRAPTSASILMPKVDLAKMANEQSTPDLLRKELEQLRKKADVLSHLYELGSLFNSVFALEEIFERMADMLFRLTPGERCLVQIKDPDTGVMKTRLIKFRSDRHNPSELFSPPRAIVDQVMREQVTLLSLDAQMDERIMGKSVLLQNVQSVICAPLMAGGQPLGVLYIDTHKSRQVFGPDDIDLLNAIAVQTSMALDNATAHDRLMHEALAREAYSRFLPDHIVNQILESPDSLKLGGTNLEATILFADVRGFTPLSEKLRPEQIVELLNDYFTDMTDIIFSHQGLLDKYIGDGLMALFGVAYAADEAPVNAAKAAIFMQRRMVTLRQNFLERFGHPISIGIGINTGTITVGYIGSNRRMEYTGIGDAVNLAARLESNTKPSQIIVSAKTHERLKDAVPTRALGKITVKGKSEPQEIFEVIWQEDQANQSQ
jgi:adenylate cyclase